MTDKWTVIIIPPNVACAEAYHVTCPEPHVVGWSRYSRVGTDSVIVLPGHVDKVRWGNRADMVPRAGDDFLRVRHWGAYVE